MKNFFFEADGAPKGTMFLAFFAVASAVLSYFLGKEVLFNLSHNFFTTGIWGPAALVVAIAIVVKSLKAFDKDYINGAGLSVLWFVAVLICWAGVFGPAVRLASDNASAIPDEDIYYANGRILNPSDASKAHYYFDHIKLSQEDSMYVVTYGEEPGYNRTNSAVRAGDYPASVAPRADEDWTRPNPIETKKNY